MQFYFKRSYQGPLKAIILDWAGTTMDYGCYAPAVVFIEVFKRKNVPISVEEARAPMGAHKKVHILEITKIKAVSDRWEEVHGRKPDENDVEAMFQEFIPLQLACLADYADLIPGTLEAVADFRDRGLMVGSTTGYTREMMELLQTEAKNRGYEPDATVCATDVPAGRPAPWMCVQNAMSLGIYPFESCVKVDDTIPGIEEGLNAGMWTIGLAKTGNEIGLNEKEIERLEPDVFQTKLDHAYRRMHQCGAHYVVDGLWCVPDVLDDINTCLARGERP
jgi:phosphonoacetaldehyde hydrolase